MLLIHARERKKSWGWVINTTRRRRLLGQTMEKQPTHGLKTEREKRECVCVYVCVCVCVCVCVYLAIDNTTQML